MTKTQQAIVTKHGFGAADFYIVTNGEWSYDGFTAEQYLSQLRDHDDWTAAAKKETEALIDALTELDVRKRAKV